MCEKNVCWVVTIIAVNILNFLGGIFDISLGNLFIKQYVGTAVAWIFLGTATILCSIFGFISYTRQKFIIYAVIMFMLSMAAVWLGVLLAGILGTLETFAFFFAIMKLVGAAISSVAAFKFVSK